MRWTKGKNRQTKIAVSITETRLVISKWTIVWTPTWTTIWTRDSGIDLLRWGVRIDQRLAWCCCAPNCLPCSNISAGLTSSAGHKLQVCRRSSSRSGEVQSWCVVAWRPVVQSLQETRCPTYNRISNVEHNLLKATYMATRQSLLPRNRVEEGFQLRLCSSKHTKVFQLVPKTTMLTAQMNRRWNDSNWNLLLLQDRCLCNRRYGTEPGRVFALWDSHVWIDLNREVVQRSYYKTCSGFFLLDEIPALLRNFHVAEDSAAMLVLLRFFDQQTVNHKLPNESLSIFLWASLSVAKQGGSVRLGVVSYLLLFLDSQVQIDNVVQSQIAFHCLDGLENDDGFIG